MKKFSLLFIFLIPCLAFGQLLPNIPDFKGNVRLVTEKKYGKEFDFFGLLKKKYYAKLNSGWKNIYEFNEQSKLIKRTSTYRGETKAEYWYQYESKDNRRISREISGKRNLEKPGDYLEYESFLDENRQVVKVNSLSFNSKAGLRELFMVEQNALYQKDKLISFTRQNIDANGDLTSGEKCSLTYNSSGQLVRMERKDVETELATTLNYYYNDKGFVDHYSVDFLSGLTEFGKANPTQTIYFKYDSRGNWTKMFWKSGNKTHVEARRKIKYW